MKINENSISALNVAKWFIQNVDRESGDDITHLKLQKLVYYAQSWYLANYAKPLFNDELRRNDNLFLHIR